MSVCSGAIKCRGFKLFKLFEVNLRLSFRQIIPNCSDGANFKIQWAGADMNSINTDNLISLDQFNTGQKQQLLETSHVSLTANYGKVV